MNAESSTRPAGGRSSASSKRDGAAERLTEVEDPGGIHRGLLEQTGQRGAGVPVGALLAGPAAATAVAAIVKQQHVEPSGRQQGRVQDAIADVAGVAVAQQQMSEQAPFERRPTSRQPLAVVALQR